MVEPIVYSGILQQRFRIIQGNGATEDVGLLFINLFRISLFLKLLCKLSSISSRTILVKPNHLPFMFH